MIAVKFFSTVAWASEAAALHPDNSKDTDSLVVSSAVGNTLGAEVVGSTVGDLVGDLVGPSDGAIVGNAVGAIVGDLVASVIFAELVVTVVPRTPPTLLAKLGSAMLLKTVDAADVLSRRRPSI